MLVDLLLSVYMLSYLSLHTDYVIAVSVLVVLSCLDVGCVVVVSGLIVLSFSLCCLCCCIVHAGCTVALSVMVVVLFSLC